MYTRASSYYRRTHFIGGRLFTRDTGSYRGSISRRLTGHRVICVHLLAVIIESSTSSEVGFTKKQFNTAIRWPFFIFKFRLCFCDELIFTTVVPHHSRDLGGGGGGDKPPKNLSKPPQKPDVVQNRTLLFFKL